MIAVRSCGAADAEAASAVVARGFEAYRPLAPEGWIAPERGTAADAARLSERLAVPRAWGEVAEDAGVVVGLCAYEPARDGPATLAHLFACFVDRPYRGTGLATRLLADAVAAAAGSGFTRMRLHTAAGQAQARRFYAREGFGTDGPPWFDEALPFGLVTLSRTLR